MKKIPIWAYGCAVGSMAMVIIFSILFCCQVNPHSHGEVSHRSAFDGSSKRGITKVFEAHHGGTSARQVAAVDHPTVVAASNEPLSSTLSLSSSQPLPPRPGAYVATRAVNQGVALQQPLLAGPMPLQPEVRVLPPNPPITVKMDTVGAGFPPPGAWNGPYPAPSPDYGQVPPAYAAQPPTYSFYPPADVSHAAQQSVDPAATRLYEGAYDVRLAPADGNTASQRIEPRTLDPRGFESRMARAPDRPYADTVEPSHRPPMPGQLGQFPSQPIPGFNAPPALSYRQL